MAISLTVNGTRHSFEGDPTTPLLYFLRNDLALNGPKYGCGLEQCGACMVLIDGAKGPTCRIPMSDVEGKNITTLEALAGADGLHPVQKAFLEQQAAQCGYCTNGMIIATVSLLKENPAPSDGEIREALARNLCRCGTHSRILKAVKAAAGDHNG